MNVEQTCLIFSYLHQSICNLRIKGDLVCLLFPFPTAILLISFTQVIIPCLFVLEGSSRQPFGLHRPPVVHRPLVQD